MGIDASETLADELICLEVFDAPFGNASLGRAHLLPLGLSRDGSVPLTAQEAIPDLAQHAESLVAGAPEHSRSELLASWLLRSTQPSRTGSEEQADETCPFSRRGARRHGGWLVRCRARSSAPLSVARVRRRDCNPGAGFRPANAAFADQVVQLVNQHRCRAALATRHKPDQPPGPLTTAASRPACSVR